MSAEHVQEPLRDVVLAPPYEWGLYHLLATKNPYSPPPSRNNPFYRNIYGRHPEDEVAPTVNLACLFETIHLPMADEFLPDCHLYLDGRVYNNTELGIRVELEPYGIHEADAQARRMVSDEVTASRLTATGLLPDSTPAAVALIRRIIMQLRTSVEKKAALLCGEGVDAMVDVVFDEAIRASDDDPTDDASQSVVVTPSTLRLVGLDWECDSIDTFTMLRSSKEIRGYAAGFRSALLRSADTDDLERTLVSLMREAMDCEAVSKRVSRCFETIGVVSTFAGVVPLAGSLATFLGLGALLGTSCEARRMKEHSWYRLGARMRELSLQDVLRRA